MSKVRKKTPKKYKLLCLENSYGVLGTILNINITVGKVYDVVSYQGLPYYELKDDNRNNITAHKKFFIKLEEHRKNIINEILS